MLPGDMASVNLEQAQVLVYQKVLEHGVDLQQKSFMHNSLSNIPTRRNLGTHH